MEVKVIIPFRDRGADLRRAANLEVVMAWWYAHGGDVVVVSDGGQGDQPFNRHRAYNRAVEQFPETDLFIFTEADMLIHSDQITEAAVLALEKPGIVVPFTQYRYLSDATTAHVRNTFADLSPKEVAEWWTLPASNPSSVFDIRPESTMEDGRSIGAVNVVSRRTLDLTGGFTEATSGNWYDDNITEEAFAFLTRSKTRFVKGPAVHLYHLPGWKGDHLTEADKKATAFNKSLLDQVRRDIRRGAAKQVRDLMGVRSA